ncbi:MAG: hypothetical protein ABEH59_02090 [Halobacteriales archaeon]
MVVIEHDPRNLLWRTEKMPATQTYRKDGIIETTLEDLDLNTVQFTDETFDAELVIRNLSDKHLTGVVELANESEQTLGGKRESLTTSRIDLDLQPGETLRKRAGGTGIVGGTGTAVIVGIADPIIAESDEHAIAIEPGEAFVPLASMVFWDREFYRVNYLWPRRAQYLSVAIALLSAVLAGIIVWLTVA